MTTVPGASQSLSVALPDNVRSAVPREGDVALLIDWENLKWGLREHFRVAPNITSLIAATREFGRLVIARAYADWTQPQLSIDAPNLHRATIEPVYAQGRHHADGRPFKNSADVRLAVDTVALSTQLPHVGTFVLVTGDGDLVHPINYLRLNGKRVVVVAVQATMSSLLESAADAVLVYERDVEPLEERRIPPPDRAAPVDEAMEKLARALPMVLAGTRTKQSFTALNELMLTRFGFNPRTYGLSFKELMLEAEKRSLVQISTEGSMDFAVLPGTSAVASDAESDEEDVGPEATPYLGDVRFEHLDDDDKRKLVHYIADIEDASRFLTVKFLVDRLSHSSVLPTLSETQLKGLLLRALESGIFDVDEVPAVSPLNGERFMRRELHLNADHHAVSGYFTDE